MYSTHDTSKSQRTSLWWTLSLIGLLALLARPIAAQTTLISPAGDGGFQSGTTFAANGWNVDNGTAVNQWFLGTVPSFGTRSAFISNNGGATSAYTNTSVSVVHIWRDVTFPAGETAITLSFDWEVVGEIGFWDAVMVHVAPTSYIPTASTVSLAQGFLAPPAVNVTSVWSTGAVVGVQNRTVTIPASVVGNCTGAATVRLIFTWKNDGSGGTGPAVVDNISLTSAAPTLPLTGGVFTINNTLPTAGLNFNSFTAAINALNAAVGCGSLTGPVTFNVSAGQTFNENTPAITASGTASNTITFQKSGGGANPVITPPGTTATTDAGITILGGDFITFDGIDINASAVSAVEYGYLIRNLSATDGAQSVTVRNCAITLNRANTGSLGIVNTSGTAIGGGIAATAATGANNNCVIQNVTVTNTYLGGIRLEGIAAWPQLNNEVLDCTIGAAYTGAPTPDLGSNGASAGVVGIYGNNQNGVKIRRNTVRNIGTLATTARGIWVNLAQGTTNEVNNNIVRGIRTFSTTSTFGIARGMEINSATTGTTDLRVWNNMVSDLSTAFSGTATGTRLLSGIFLGTGSATATYNVDHNSVAIDGSTSLNASSTCLEFGGNTAVHNVRNNTFSNFTSAQTGAAIHLVIRATAANQFGAGTSISNHNNLFVANLTNGFVAQGGTSNYATVAAYDGAMTTPASNDANSISVDPIHINNFTNLRAQNTPLNGAGTPAQIAWISTDIDGETRGTPPDIGADEFTPPSCFLPSGTVVSVQNCATDQFFLNVTVTNLAGAPGVNVVSNFAGNPGADFGVGLGTFQIGPFPSNTPVVVTLERVGDASCNVVLGTFTYDCSTFGQNALDFDGGNDVVNCGTAPSINITGNQITLEAWIFPTSWRASSFEGTIINKESLASSGYMLRCGNNGQLSFAFGNGTSFPEVQSATGTLTLNTWQHVAATYDGTTMRIFRNGVQVGSNTITTTIAAAPTIALALGSSVSYPTRTFVGRIDEVRIWNVARSAAEIAANQGIQACPGTGGLQAYYQFDQGVESANNAGVTNLPDVSGNGNNGTLANFALNGATSNWVIGRTGLTICPSCSGAPTAGTITGTASVCAGVSNVLNATGASFGLGITYQWKYRANGSGDPFINLGTTTSQNTNSLPFGTWEVVFDVTCTTSSTTTSSAPFVLTLAQSPTASASAGPACVGQAINFTGTTNIGTTFAWTGPNGFTSALQNPTIASATLAASGTYSFTASAAGCTSAPATVAVTVNQAPIIASVTATPNPACVGVSSQLNVNASDPSQTNVNVYSFFTDGALGTLDPMTGATTRLTADNDDTPMGAPAPIGFNFTYNGVSYSQFSVSPDGWILLGGATAVVQFTNATTSTTNIPKISAYWDDLATGTTGNVTTVVTGTAPNRIFKVQWFVTIPRNLTGAANSTFQAWLYEADGTIEYRYGTMASGAMSATVGLTGGATNFQSVTIASNTVSTTTANDLNAGQPATGRLYRFTPPVSVLNYAWTPSPNFTTPINIQNPQANANVTAPGETFTVSVSNANCSTTGTVALIANPGISAATITPPTPQFCAGGSVTLTAAPVQGGAPFTYAWTGPSGPAGSAATQVANLPGLWSVSITDACGGPAATASVTVIENALPTATASNGQACTGQPLSFTGTSNGVSFTWTGPAGFTSTLQNPTIPLPTTANSGNYIFTAFSAEGCSSGPFTLPVTVNAAPNITTAASATPNPVCVGGSTQLNVGIGLGLRITEVTLFRTGTGATATYPAFATGADLVEVSNVSGTSADISGWQLRTFPSASATATATVTFPAGTIVPANGVVIVHIGTGTDDPANFYFNSGTASDALSSGSLVGVVLANGSTIVDAVGVNSGYTFAAGTGVTASNWSGFAPSPGGFAGTIRVAGSDSNTGADWVQSNAPSPLQTIGTINPSLGGGSTTISWSPATYLNNASVQNPVASNVLGDINYTVTATSNGCSVSSSVNVQTEPGPQAAVTVDRDCSGGTFTLNVNVSSTGVNPTVNIAYSVNGGTAVIVPVGTGSTTIPAAGTFALGDEIEVELRSLNGQCVVGLGEFTDNCPILLNCGTTTTVNYCYKNNDPKIWTFTTTVPGETVTLTFVSGTIDAAGDVVRIYDGEDNLGTLLVSSTVSSLAGLTATSTGQSLFMEIDSDGSNSCADAGQTPWVFEVECTAGCVDPDGSVTLTTDCSTLTFSLDVEVLFVGDAPNGTTSLSYTVNGGSPIVIGGLVDFDVTNIGPFNIGDAVNVSLLHETDPTCNRSLGTFTQSVSFCPNDQVCEARPVPVNPNYTCGTTVPGTMVGATLSAGITGGCTGVNQDVWYRFVANAPTHRVQLGGTTAGLSYSLYTGASCNGPLTLHPGFGCIAGATVTNYNGLTTGTTYYLRVSRTAAGTNVFTVCVSAPPAADIGQNALHFEGTTTGSNDRVNCGNASSVDITGNAITMEAWIFPTAWRASSFQGSIINKEGSNTTGYMIRCGNNGQLSANIGTGTTWVERISATGALTLNTWQHVAATYDGTNLRIYRDGVELTPLTSTGTPGPIASTGPLQQLTIGNWSQDNTRGFVGRIDEVRIWNTTLSGATIAANLNQQLCGGEPGLRAYYQFNQGVDGGNNTTETTLLDLSGNGNNGTLVNMTLTGPTSNWVQGRTGMLACPPCASAPTAGTVNGTASVCAGTPSNLNLLGATTGTGISYQWYYGPVGNPTANLLGTGLLQSTLSIPVGTWEVVADVTCAGFGTATTAPFTFTKNPTPTATVQLTSPTACVGAPFSVLGLTDIGTSFAWTGPNGFTSTNQDAIVNGTAALTNGGTYSFTASLNGCTSPAATAVQTVTFSPVLSSVTATPNPLCENTGTSQLNAVASVPTPANAMVFSTSTGSNLADMTGALQAIGTSNDDTPTSNLNIGFSFTFNGVAYTQFAVSPDGWIRLGAGAASNQFTNQVTSTTNIPKIYPYWDDMATGSNGNVRYLVTGSAPNRILVVQWFVTIPRATGGAANSTFQLWLYETSNAIEFRYGTMGSAAMTASAGLTATATNFQSLTLATNTVSTTTPVDNNAGQPASGRLYRFEGSALTYAWSPGANLSATNIANPVFGPASAGSYPLTVTATDAASGCSATGSVTVNVNPALAAGQVNIAGDPFFCGAGTTTLTANTTGGGAPFTYAWTNPNNAAAGTAQTVNANIAGTWSVLVTDACGGTATASVVVEGRPQPTATASSGVACSGSPIDLTGTTDIGTSFQWTGPNGFSSTLQNPSIPAATSANSGVYTFVATLNGCSTSSTVNVTVFDPPALAAVTATPASICTGLNAQLNAVVNTEPYVVVPVGFAPVSGTGTSPVSGDDVVSSAVAIGFPFPFYGTTFNNVFISTNGFLSFDSGGGAGCCAGQVMPDGAAPNNVIALAWEDLNAGAGQITTFNLTNPSRFVVQYNNVPRFGATGVVNGQIILYADGVVEMQITNITGGTSDFTTQGIENGSGSQATVIAGRNSTIWSAANQAFRFVPVTTTISWSPATFLSSTTIANPVVTAATETTTYTVTVTGAGGCTSQGTVTLTVNPLPTVNAGTYAPVCGLTAPAVALNQGSPAGGTYLGAGVTGPTGNQVFNPASGTQTLTYSFTDANGCPGTAQTTITVITADTDGDGLIDCLDNCPNIFGQIGQACNAGPGFVLGVIDANCVCVGQQCTTDLILEFQTDGAPFETTWEIRSEGTNLLVQSGGPLVAPFGIQTESTCLPDGCYSLRVLDASGDGMTTGGYILRTAVTNQRIIDNRNNFSTGSVSTVSGGQPFCLPMSNQGLLFTSCDKLDWITGQYVVAAPNAAVSAEWIPNGANSVQDADSGYEFWIFDPNGSYSFRRFRSHNVSDGFGPASATRACHMRMNNWAVANQVPANVLMNVRVRTRVNGVNGEFGPACRLMIDPVRAACPLTNLMDVPGNQFFSCGVFRNWGTGNLVHARPVTGANRYQFRFRIAAEGFEVVRTATTYFVQLNWPASQAPALQNGKTYDVDVRISRDGGLTWCTSNDPWGNVCQVTIGMPNMGLMADQENTVNGAELSMFPNPNRGDQVTFRLSAIEEGVNAVTFEVYDLSGKRAMNRVIAVAGNNVNTIVDLNGELAAGMYLVNITAGIKTYTERLMVQP